MIPVSQLCGYIKGIFDAEEILHDICIFGEVSNFSVSAGHAYFVIKDEESTLSCTCFGIARVSKYIPKVGDSVILRGRPSFYVKGGKLSFNVSAIEPYGAGQLYVQFEQLKVKLEQEGLFSEAHKVKIPKYACHIGIITSEKGAVLQDIINVSKRRNERVSLTVYPVQVQGLAAAKQICEALEYMDKQGFDTLILARGGGSLEDLTPFYDEKVARAVYAVETPIISAIGHDTDYVLTDFVADLRAPTPSAAAELAVFDWTEAKAKTVNMIADLSKQMIAKLSVARLQVSAQVSSLSFGMQTRYHEMKSELMRVTQLMCVETAHQLELRTTRLHQQMTKLDERSPLKILQRGYARVEKWNQQVRSIGEIQVGDKVNIRFADGSVDAEIIEPQLARHVEKE